MSDTPRIGPIGGGGDFTIVSVSGVNCAGGTAYPSYSEGRLTNSNDGNNATPGDGSFGIWRWLAFTLNSDGSYAYDGLYRLQVSITGWYNLWVTFVCAGVTTGVGNFYTVRLRTTSGGTVGQNTVFGPAPLAFWSPTVWLAAGNVFMNSGDYVWVELRGVGVGLQKQAAGDGLDALLVST